MDTTPNWAKVNEYKASVVKPELIAMALALHHAYTTLRAEDRAKDMALIEARTTIKAQAVQIEANAHTLRSLTAAVKRSAPDEARGDKTRLMVEFGLSAEQFITVLKDYCNLHGVGSAAPQQLRDFLKETA